MLVFNSISDHIILFSNNLSIQRPKNLTKPIIKSKA